MQTYILKTNSVKSEEPEKNNYGRSPELDYAKSTLCKQDDSCYRTNLG
jgi:hypothetical protein